MEFLDRLGDWFNAVFGTIERFITGLFGSSNERRIRQIGFARDKSGRTSITPGSLLEHINRFEPEWEAKSDDELRQTASIFRDRLTAGATQDELLPEAFAAVRESSRRSLKMRHYDVQMIGGYILHQGMIAEMVTGEGKTLVATLPAFLNALTGHVHVVTVNDYLAKRDMEWMGPVHMGLGLRVGAIQSQMTPQERQKEYAADITYGTNNEFGFDYLRDNMKPTKEVQVQGPLDFAVVDEIDNILIDEARTPLIISGPAHDDLTKYPRANRIVQQLKPGVDFEIKEKEHTCHLTEDGVRHAEELAGVESFYSAGNMEWPHLLDNALKAHHLYKRDVNYVVEGGAVVIVDEFTGRKMYGRQWSDGLHQAVEAREGVTIKEESQTLATITLQNYFKLYKKLAGMTGTAMTEAAEFWKIYKLDVVAIPTNMPLRRVNHPDLIFRSEKEKWSAVVEDIRDVHETGRPVLVGTTSIEQSELLSSRLNKYGIQHNVLNAKYHEREAEIIAQAGRKSGVTIATNMAGRGTDIVLGGNPEHAAWEELKQKYESRLDVSKSEWDELIRSIAEREGMDKEGAEVAESGGLHVIGTERHDSRRIDNQLRGRAGRQGDPGSSRFVISLEDKLMRLFAGEFVQRVLAWAGMQEDEAIESNMVTKRVEGAQKKIEERHFDQRKHLLEYDEVMDEQRKRVYSYRQRILDGTNCRELILEMVDEQIEKWTRHFLDPQYRWDTIAQWTGQNLHIETTAPDVRGMDYDQVKVFLNDEARRQAEDIITEQIEENLPDDAEDKSLWNWQTLSRWANRQYGLNTNDRELKKIGRENLFSYLSRRSDDAIEKYDYSPVQAILSDDFGRRALCDWLHFHFTLKLPPERLPDEDIDATIRLIRQEVLDLYAEKEVAFPVAVGMHNFMAEASSRGGERYNREGLVQWANLRFGSDLTTESVSNRPRREVEAMLLDSSRRYFRNGDITTAVDDRLERTFPEMDGNGQSAAGQHEAAAQQLAEWASEEFQLEVQPEDFESLTRSQVRDRLLTEFDTRYRPELHQAERSLLLEVLDTAWKDHLFYMGHVRDGIGLVGYAQKDPKTEYKREGRRAFNSMWERVGEQVTSMIFRLDRESPAFVGSLWQVTAATHEVATDDVAAQGGDGESLEPGQTPQTVEPIRNKIPKVGRNDPCPCGSGRKFKKCCGVGA